MSNIDAFFLNIIDRACLAESIARGFGYHELESGEKAYHTEIMATVISAINSLNPDDLKGFGQQLLGQLSPSTITVLAELANPPKPPQGRLLV